MPMADRLAPKSPTDPLGARPRTRRIVEIAIAGAYLAAIAPLAVRWADTGSGHLQGGVLFGLAGLASLIAGFLLRRWWALSLPLIPFAYVVARAAVDSTAGFEEGWGFYLFALLVEEVALLALATGMSRRARPSPGRSRSAEPLP
jgi:hypothetical protein